MRGVGVGGFGGEFVNVKIRLTQGECQPILYYPHPTGTTA